jgi:ankyrin repeat protein
MEVIELKTHLENSKEIFDLTEIYDRSGYSPLHFAAYKNSDKICTVLCDFVLTRGETGMIDDSIQEERRAILKEWINQHSKGEEGFTALHFASFHGNMKLIKMLISHGANIHAKNRQDINMLHVAA